MTRSLRIDIPGRDTEYSPAENKLERECLKVSIDQTGAGIMVLEVALLDVIPGQEAEFLKSFNDAQKIISSMPGYLNHDLKRCIEKSARFILLVNWKSLEDHTVGFRGSPQYQEWKGLLHHYYDPFPEVEHYESINY